MQKVRGAPTSGTTLAMGALMSLHPIKMSNLVPLLLVLALALGTAVASAASAAG